MPRKRIFVAALVVALALVAGWVGVGSASHTDPDEVHACVKDSKDGTTATFKRFVDDPASCVASKGETALTWNTKGANGVAGPQGATGAGFERPGFALEPVDSTTDDVGFFDSITVGADGLPIASEYDITNAHLKVVHCGDATCSSGNSVQTVDPATAVGEWTSITIGADGLPIVSYSDANNSDLKVAHCGDVTCSSGNTTQTVNQTTDDVGRFTSITVGADGFPVISYYDDTNHDLKVAHCSSVDCSSFDTPQVVDSTNDVGQFTSITIGADGLPVVSYYDNTNGDLKVAHCGNPQCGTKTTQTVDSTGNVGRSTSVAIGPDGFPVVSYYDATNGDLKVAHCMSVDCSASDTPDTVDSTGNVGDFTSIAIGSDGRPVVSYADDGNVDLKVAHCGDAACSSNNSIQKVAFQGSVGEFTSITIGLDGLPLIGYYDNTDLSIAHCSNVFCTPFYRRR